MKKNDWLSFDMHLKNCCKQKKHKPKSIVHASVTKARLRQNTTSIGQECNKVKDNTNKDIKNDKELASFERSNRLEHLTACNSIQSNLKYLPCY